MAKGDIKIELTEDFGGLKKGDVIERSKSIANIHINKLENAKLYVPKNKVKKKK